MDHPLLDERWRDPFFQESSPELRAEQVRKDQENEDEQPRVGLEVFGRCAAGRWCQTWGRVIVVESDYILLVGGMDIGLIRGKTKNTIHALVIVRDGAVREDRAGNEEKHRSKKGGDDHVRWVHIELYTVIITRNENEMI